MKSGKLTSRQLLDYYIKRIEHLNPKLNAVVATDFSAARARADAADRCRAAGESWGPLHGLPMTVKDTYEVQGMPCVAGAPELKKHLPRKDAAAVQQLEQAGAIIFGKTNVPMFASDLQSYNQVYGTTHNPWNLETTPGGSSGGAAAALAAGFTPLELGSDIAGSIRTPAHFCGVFGHKPTHGIVSLRGHIPGPSGQVSEPDLAVAGPMARSAEDLQLVLDAVTKSHPLQDPGWQLKLPAAKQRKLQDFKVLLWFDDPMCMVASDMRAVFAELQDALQQQGVAVTVGSPLGMGLEDFYPLYMTLVAGAMSTSHKLMERRIMSLAAPLVSRFWDKFQLQRYSERYFEGVNQSHASWLSSNEKRLKLREKFQRVFDEYDVILCPNNMVTGFRHYQEQDLTRRKLTVNGEQRNYTDMFLWIAPATLLGLPATSAPVGIAADSMPVNVQILGGMYQDKTTIKFAHFLEKAGFTFKAPPGY